MIGRGGGRNLSADRKRTTTHLRAIAAVLWLTLPIFDMSPPRPPPPPPVGLRFLSKVFQESAVAPHHAFFFCCCCLFLYRDAFDYLCDSSKPLWDSFYWARTF